ncbi:MAG: N-acetyltransferase family protein [Phycisphaerales bacterium]|nr:N-acetyltransferase [Planctomycetota bacterium]
MLVRPAREPDFEAIAALTNYFIRETTIHFGTVEQGASELLEQWRTARDRYPFLVAEVDGRFAGYCKAYQWRSREAYQWTPECGVYVEEFARRRGVARALYVQLFDVLARHGFHSVVAGIALPNEPSVRLHESLGFAASGIVRDAGWKLGRWVDVGFWQKLLGPGAPPKALEKPRD